MNKSDHLRKQIGRGKQSLSLALISILGLGVGGPSQSTEPLKRGDKTYCRKCGYQMKGCRCS